MTSTTREGSTASTENSMGITRKRREVTRREDTTMANIMSNIMERRAITIKVTIMTTTRATRVNMATRSITHMKKTIVKRVTMKGERNGRTVLALGVAVKSMADIRAAVNTEVGVAVETMVQAMVMMVMLSMVADRCLHGQYCHKNIHVLNVTSMSQSETHPVIFSRILLYCKRLISLQD
jgi:hypothetical protein